VKNNVTKEGEIDIWFQVLGLFNLKNMEAQAIESKRQKLTELDARVDEAASNTGSSRRILQL
jgi:hypothetical protein